MGTAAGFLQALVDRINANPDRFGVKEAEFLFTLSGDEGGQWVLRVSQGRASLEEGAAASPDVTIEMSAQDFQEMAAGRLGPVAAYMSGRLKIAGDIGLAMRLQPLLS